MAVTTVSITGHVLGPSGVAPTSGKVTIRLSQHGSTLDGSESVRVAGEHSVTLGAGGALTVALVPNDAIVPSGTYYLAEYVLRLPNGRSWSKAERWQLTSDDLTIDLGSVPRLDVVPGIAVATESAVSASVLASATASASSASASAAAAAASEGVAVGAEAAADAARISAETARDQAQNASGTYADTTAGLAATASGGYFYTPDGAGGLIRYLDNAGTAVEVGRVAAGAVVSELLASVPPRSTDSSGHLDYAADQAGRVYRYTKADGGLMLAGRDESVQTRLAELDGIQVQADTAGWQDFGLDAQGRVVRAVDTEGGLRLAGRAESVQKSITKAEALAGLLYRPKGGVVLPAGFTPMAKPMRPEERYIWSSMPAALRPDPWSRKVVIYPFEWDTQDLVVPSMMCRRVGTLATSPYQADQVTWGPEETLTVNAPAGFFDNADPNLRRQFRDGSHLYDRKTGYYWYADSAITNTASGWNARNIPLFRSSDGLTWDLIAYTPDFLPDPEVCKLATPEWFVDGDGTLYIIVSGTKSYTTIPRNTWVIRCDAPDDMSAWTEIGEITGSAIPTRNAGGLPETIDCHLFQRDGVYYYIWRAESAPDGAGSEDWGQIGIAWATSLLGPYNSGHRFTDPNGAKLNGEGISVVELPPGGPYRFRMYWDNFRDKVYGGITAEHVWADTNDFISWTVPRSTLLPTGSGGKDRNTAFVIGYP